MQEDPTLVFDKIQATMEVWKESGGHMTQSIPEDSREMENTMNDAQAQLPPIKIPNDARVLTRDILLGKMLSKPKQIGW